MKSMNKLFAAVALVCTSMAAQADSMIGKTLGIAGEHVKYVAIDKATDVAIDKATEKAKEIAFSETLKGTVIRVLDGDTLDLLTPDNKVSRIRLDSIDAPEKAQPYGEQAKDALYDWVNAQPVIVEVKSKDKYGRLIGVVLLEGVNVNQAMVQKGYAFAFTPFIRDKDMPVFEAQAHAKHVGLWSQDDSKIVKPWDYRQSIKK